MNLLEFLELLDVATLETVMADLERLSGSDAKAAKQRAAQDIMEDVLDERYACGEGAPDPTYTDPENTNP